MIRMTLTMLSNQIVWRDFDNQQLAEEYIAEVSSNGNWGTPQCTLVLVPEQTIIHEAIPYSPAIPAQPPIPAVFDEEDNEITPMVPAMPEVPEVLAVEAWTETIPAVYETTPGFTVVYEDITEILAKEAALKLKLEAGKINREKCDKVRDFIGGLNSGNLTIEQIDQMEIAFAPIQMALINLRPDKARAMILAVVPDGIMVTQEMKDTILGIL